MIDLNSKRALRTVFKLRNGWLACIFQNIGGATVFTALDDDPGWQCVDNVQHYFASLDHARDDSKDIVAYVTFLSQADVIEHVMDFRKPERWDWERKHIIPVPLDEAKRIIAQAKGCDIERIMIQND